MDYAFVCSFIKVIFWIALIVPIPISFWHSQLVWSQSCPLLVTHFKGSQWRKRISSKKRSCCSATLASPAAIPPSRQSQRRKGGWFHPWVQLSGGPHDPAQVGTPRKVSKSGSCLPSLPEQALNIQAVGKVLVCICRWWGMPPYLASMAWIHHPPASCRSQSCTLARILFRLAQKSWHRTLAAQAVCLSAAVSFWSFPSSVPAHVKYLNLWCSPEPQAALTRGSGLLLLCSEHGMVSLSWLAGVFFWGVCCTTGRTFAWQYRAVCVWGGLSCIHVKFIVILVNCPVQWQLWVLLQRSSVCLDKCWHCSDYPQRIHIAPCQKVFSKTAALKA